MEDRTTSGITSTARGDTPARSGLSSPTTTLDQGMRRLKKDVSLHQSAAPWSKVAVESVDPGNPSQLSGDPYLLIRPFLLTPLPFPILPRILPNAQFLSSVMLNHQTTMTSSLHHLQLGGTSTYRMVHNTVHLLPTIFNIQTPTTETRLWLQLLIRQHRINLPSTTPRSGRLPKGGNIMSNQSPQPYDPSSGYDTEYDDVWQSRPLTQPVHTSNGIIHSNLSPAIIDVRPHQKVALAQQYPRSTPPKSHSYDESPTSQYSRDDGYGAWPNRDGGAVDEDAAPPAPPAHRHSGSRRSPQSQGRMLPESYAPIPAPRHLISEMDVAALVAVLCLRFIAMFHIQDTGRHHQSIRNLIPTLLIPFPLARHTAN